MRPFVSLLSLAALASVIFVTPRSSQAQTVSPYEQILADKRIQANTAALRQYLIDLHPTDDLRERSKELIKQLGDEDSFQLREEAMAKLLIMPTLPTELLVAAAEGPDPEIRWRAKRVLAVGKPESTKVMHAALKVIAEKKITGLVPQILAAIPMCDKSHLKNAAREALTGSAQDEDRETLAAALRDPNTEVRAAATEAFAASQKEKAIEQLVEKLGDEADLVKLAAARGLANHGDRRSLKALTQLLASEELNARVSASSALRQLTGQHFAFAAYDKADKRETAINKWNDWIAGPGAKAELTYPLKNWGSGVGYLGGNTLLAYGYQNKVAEYDPDMKEIWSYPAKGAWSAEKMANGNVLIAEYNGNRVIEVTPENKVVWEHAITNPLNAKPLENGNILIAQHSGNLAVEISPDKKIVWQFKTPGNCSDVHRLDNGNTLIASYGKSVIEVTPEGKTVWDYPAASQSYGCSPLPNGNVLITNFDGRVMEVTRDKKVIWEFKENNAVDAFRLPNGNTLITGGSRFVEVTPDKKTIWTKSGCSYGTARR